ncbi:hypothetical protein F5Y03DRAFT_181049 [Xylaria venustula]|nr:hypothetical protein F5Y03DRAFT_181049 [Xylaria venustula]
MQDAHKERPPRYGATGLQSYLSLCLYLCLCLCLCQTWYADEMIAEEARLRATETETLLFVSNFRCSEARTTKRSSSMYMSRMRCTGRTATQRWRAWAGCGQYKVARSCTEIFQRQTGDGGDFELS